MKNELQETKTDLNYKGQYPEYQMSGNSRNNQKYSKIDGILLNDYQKFLYNRALFGFKAYNLQDVELMPVTKKKRITRLNRKTQVILNIWKQQLVNDMTTSIFKKYFPKTKWTEFFMNTNDQTDPEFTNNMSFKDLNISKTDIINKLIERKVLPLNFYQLKN